MPLQSTCVRCGAAFLVKPNTAGRYCSRVCSGLARTTLVERTCERCGASFFIKPSKIALAARKGYALYCSQACSADRQRQRPTVAWCERCGEAFAPQPKTAGRFCSRVCFLGSEDNPEARFWARVDKDGPTPPRHAELGNCWDWTGATYVNGYGYLRIDGKQIKAHRFACFLQGIPLEGDQDALHHCDRRVCVRGEHVYAGDHYDNQTDVAEAGTRKGEGNPRAKLTEGQVRLIRDSGAATWTAYRILAQHYDVHAVTIYEIIKGRRWGHLDR